MSAKIEHSVFDNHYVLLGFGLAAGLAAMLMQFKFDPLIILGISIAPLMLIVSFRHPYIPVVLFAVFSFLRVHEAYPGIKPLRLILATAALSLLVLGWHAVIARTIKPVWALELRLLMAFFFLVSLGVLFSFNPEHAIDYWLSTFIKIMVMVPAIAWLIHSPSDFNWTNRIIVTGGILIAARVLYNKVYSLSLIEGTRVTIGSDAPQSTDNPFLPLNPEIDLKAVAVLADPNDLALVMLFPLSFAAALLVYRSGFFNIVLGLAGVSMITMGIIATQSRGGLLGILAVGGVIGLRLIKSKILLGVIGAIAFVGLFVAMGIGGRSSGGYEELAGSSIDESSLGRIIAWQAALNMVLHHPLTGVGLHNFKEAFETYTFVWPAPAKDVHSTWFGILAETGIPGFIIFMIMLFVTIRTAIRDHMLLKQSTAPMEIKAMSMAQIAGLASFCIAGTFLTQGFTWPLYILIALTVAINGYTSKYLSPKT